MRKEKTQTVGVHFDTLTLKRIERQAERKYGHIQGNLQSYIRNATMTQIHVDEEKEESKRPFGDEKT